MGRLALLTLAVLLVAAPSASAARVYRDPDAGVEVRVARGMATVFFAEPTCGDDSVRTRVRGRRFSRTSQFACDPGGVAAAQTLKVAGIVGDRRVVGHVEGRRFIALRGAPRPTLAQRCGHRGLTLVQTDAVRVFRDDDLTIACRRRDGAVVEIGRYVPDEADYYASGTAAWSIEAIGTRVAFAQAPFNTAASKYGDADNPVFDPTVVVRDLETGTEARIAPELRNVQAVALHPDGRVAWAGNQSRTYGGETSVKTFRDGNVLTLDQGKIDAYSLRAEGDGFAWDR